MTDSLSGLYSDISYTLLAVSIYSACNYHVSLQDFSKVSEINKSVLYIAMTDIQFRQLSEPGLRQQNRKKISEGFRNFKDSLVQWMRLNRKAYGKTEKRRH